MRTRFWLEAVLAALSLIVLVATLAVPDWIEEVFGVDPDGGNGALEWAIVFASAALAVSASALARRDWRAAQADGA